MLPTTAKIWWRRLFHIRWLSPAVASLSPGAWVERRVTFQANPHHCSPLPLDSTTVLGQHRLTTSPHEHELPNYPMDGALTVLFGHQWLESRYSCCSVFIFMYMLLSEPTVSISQALCCASHLPRDVVVGTLAHGGILSQASRCKAEHERKKPLYLL